MKKKEIFIHEDIIWEQKPSAHARFIYFYFQNRPMYCLRVKQSNDKL